MNKEDLFYNVKFSIDQLEAIKKIYYKYFHSKIPEYKGKGIVALWYPDAKWESGVGYDKNHSNPGIISEECRDDPLWNVFGELLQYMGRYATITKISPNQVMYPHVDRKWRPNAIYFPIDGCTEECVSEYYDLPKSNTENSQSINFFPVPKFSYSVKDYAVLTNVHEWHGVKNNSNIERIAFGWNFKSPDYSFQDCLRIIKTLGF